jgi:hypothetical protein
MPNDGTIVREQLGAELTTQSEVAAQAVAAAARADIESRFILAKKFPRDLDLVRAALLKECHRPGFAASAIYRKPIGNVKNQRTGKWEQGFVEGLSVRFAEAALRHLRNIYVSVVAIFDDSEKTIQRITVMDLESVSTIAVDITVAKVVERSRLREDQEAVARRRNAAGKEVFVVAASDDQIMNKVNAGVSKVLRNGVLRLLPGDIADECEALCRRTMADKDAKDPDEAKRAIFDAFSGIGVGVEKLKTYLGHDGAALQPAELAQLRAIYSAIRDGETTWESVVGTAEAAESSIAADAQAAGMKAKVSEVVNRYQQNRGKPKPADTPPADAKPAADPPPTEPAEELTEAQKLAREAAEFEQAEAEKNGQ